VAEAQECEHDFDRIGQGSYDGSRPGWTLRRVLLPPLPVESCRRARHGSTAQKSQPSMVPSDGAAMTDYSGRMGDTDG
jgi:hypothetical protein